MSKLNTYYAELKAALTEAGHTMSEGEFWTPADNKAYIEHTRFKGAKDAFHNLYNLAFTHPIHASTESTVGLEVGKLSPVLSDGKSAIAEAATESGESQLEPAIPTPTPEPAIPTPTPEPIAPEVVPTPEVEEQALVEVQVQVQPVVPEVAPAPVEQAQVQSTLNADGSQKVASTSAPTISITGAPLDTATNIFKE